MPLFAASIRSSPGTSPARRAQAALDAGFEKLALLAPLVRPELEALRTLLPRERVCLLELTVPYPRGASPVGPSPIRLGSRDPDDRRAALRQAIEAAELADDLGTPFVLVPPIRLDPELATAQTRLRTHRHVTGLLESVLRSRATAARPRLEALRWLVSTLADAADRYRVRVVIETGPGVGFVPDPLEAVDLLREFRGGPLGIWADTASFAVWRAIRATGSPPAPPQAAAPWPQARPSVPDDEADTGIPGWRDLRPAVSGLTLRDLDEDWEARDPGHGRIDWTALRPVLDAAAVWLLDPALEAGVEDLRYALEVASRWSCPPRGGPPKLLPW